jgi:thioredoxin reductase
LSLPDADVAVIGAGTFGISVGLALHRGGLDVRVFGPPFSLWRGHTLPGFALRSDARASGVYCGAGKLGLAAWLRARLPPRAARHWMMRRIPGPLFRAYLRDVLHRLPFARCDDRVAHLAGSAGVFRIRTSAGEETTARRVVIATGIDNHRHLPAVLRALPGGRVVHSWHAADVARIHGERVLVVGGGQSGAEATSLLAGTNRVTWIHRSQLGFFSEPLGLPDPAFRVMLGVAANLRRLPPGARRVAGRQFTRPTITPNFRRLLRRVRARRERVAVEDVGLRGGDAGVSSTRLEETYDRVVACTGYRPRLETLGFLDPALRGSVRQTADGPVLDGGFRTSVPGLLVAGALAEGSHGAAQRFMMGARAAALGVRGALVS